MGSSSCMRSKCQTIFLNVKGFSPRQLVFGKNINLLWSINDTLSTTFSEICLVL